MRLFFDEDTGRGVPDALRAVGVQCEYVSNRFAKRGGVPLETPDELWIPYAGRKRLLVFSCNKAILDAEAQRNLLISEKVGAVFLTSGQEKKIDLLLLVLKKLDWLSEIDEATPRPFAYTITIHGNWRRVF